MPFQNYSIVNSKDSALLVNGVLKKTYFLLSLTLLFSAFTAYLSFSLHVRPGFAITLLGMFGLLFLTEKLRDSPWGIVAAFAFTGFMGFTLGPMLDSVIHVFSNGRQIISTSLGATGIIFLSLSGYVLTTRKNFNYLSGVLFIASIVVFLAAIAGIFLKIPVFNLLVSGAFALVSSAYILYTTSEIIHGGETNPVVATVSLFISLYNLFVSLMRILSAFGGNRN